MLGGLLASCSSIRKRARSTKTISSSASAESKRRKQPTFCQTEYALEIQQEQKIADILEEKILDYKTRILRLKSSSTAKAATPQQQRMLRSQVMDEALRVQQERLLMERMTMAKPARLALSNDDKQHQDEDHKILIKETVLCRNKMAQKVFDTQYQLDAVRSEMDKVTREGKTLQEKNSQALKNMKQQADSSQSQSSQHAVPGQTNERDRVADETLILKRVLAELIAGNGLDWYKDQRIQETFMKLE